MARLGRRQPNRPIILRGKIVPAYVASSDTGGTTAANFTVPSLSAVANDIIVVGAYLEPSVTVTPPDGTWTEISTAATTGTRLRVFWHRAAGAETTYVFTHASTFRRALAVRISNCVDTGSPFNFTPDIQFDNAASTSTVGVSGTTTLDNTLLVWFATEIAGGDAFTSPTGLTERIDTASITVATGLDVTAGATGTLTGTCGSSAERIAWLGALQAVAVTGGTNAPAENVAWTALALDSVTIVAPGAENVLVNAQALDGAGAVAASAENVLVNAQALDGSGSVAPGAEYVPVNAQASDPSAIIAPVVEYVPVNAQALDATVLTGTLVFPEVASVTALAQDTTAQVSPVVETVAVASSVQDAAVSVSPVVEYVAIASAAQDATTKVAPTPTEAPVNAFALDATVLTGTLAFAESVAITVQANDSQSAIKASSDYSLVIASVQDATVAIGISANAEVAAVTALAQDPLSSIGASPDTVALLVLAIDALVSITLGGQRGVGAVVTAGTAGAVSPGDADHGRVLEGAVSGSVYLP